MVVEIVLTQGHAKEALGQEFPHGMVAGALIAVVGEGLGQPGGDPEVAVKLVRNNAPPSLERN